MPRDPHEVLGIPKGATAEQVRAAYKRRALDLNPDRVPGRKAEWLELQQAYQWLTKGEPKQSRIESEQFVVDMAAKIEPALQDAVNYGASYAAERLGKIGGGGWFKNCVQAVGKVVISESQEWLHGAVSEGVRRARKAD